MYYTFAFVPPNVSAGTVHQAALSPLSRFTMPTVGQILNNTDVLERHVVPHIPNGIGAHFAFTNADKVIPAQPRIILLCQKLAQPFSDQLGAIHQPVVTYVM